MEMWKNLPLPPWGMARVKKSFSPSLENSGFSFWRQKHATCWFHRMKLVFFLNMTQICVSILTCLCSHPSLSSSCFCRDTLAAFSCIKRVRTTFETHNTQDIGLPSCRLLSWPHTASVWRCSGLCSASWWPVWWWWPISPWSRSTRWKNTERWLNNVQPRLRRLWISIVSGQTINHQRGKNMRT